MKLSLPFLQTLGLTESEAGLYELLLTLGEVPANKVVEESKLKRPTVYKALYSLEKKGLVKTSDKNKKIHFRPESPTKLLQLADSQHQLLERSRNDLRAVMSDLISSYIVSVEKPVISTYEGKEGLQKVFEDIYAPKEEPVWGCVDLEKADEAIPAYVTKKLIPLRIKHKVFAKSFIASSVAADKVHANDMNALRESVLLNKLNYPLPAEIDVYDDKVAMLSFAQGQFVGLLIQNKDIATSLKSIFKLAFEQSQAHPPTPRVEKE